ncbi:hydroxyphenylacetyl-CoA thioesterase PaaI [Aromatoleum evansii]|uniref:PaaI n=1 Tax=Aromatoleum evansii TaxID=59406 RepID=Q9F9V0_AROEV|nr:hydroxyphenylacetyl-CoA thioesterase PaaI [Aromatoleum evansii]AAG28967.1 PaaI [Aromatoleum evansii]NMG31784.1 hydroxyphenylacetyl-CoA thioesterase PaaI [Aromatoleum evansii]WRL46799.1 hydroxyphenylacetyl-CoA thioesterase PaaI [Aromatoleum evansii]
MTEAGYRDLTNGLDPQLVAERVRDGMSENDRVLHANGIRFEAIGPGYAKVTMTVREDMLNGFDICHGGFITLLADTAFAYACNSGNEQTVASGISLDFMAPGRPGEVLCAEAKEVFAAGRTGVYDISVTNPKGELIAVMRGKSYRLKGRAVVEL